MEWVVPSSDPHVALTEVLDLLSRGKQDLVLDGLSLGTAQLTAIDAAKFAAWLACNRTVRSLALHDCPTELCQIAAAALKHNATLRSFTCVEHGYGEVRHEGIVALADALNHNATLTSFAVRDFVVTEVAGTALADSLVYNGTLKSFEFSRASTETGVALAEALKRNRALESFRVGFLGYADVERPGVAFAGVLKHNVTLKSFAMHGNRKRSKAAGMALADALTHNSTLKSFAFDDSCEETGVAMVEALKRNRTLECFTVNFLYGTDVGRSVVAYADFLARTTTLKSVAFCSHIDNVGIEVAGMALAGALQRTGTLESFSLHAGSDRNVHYAYDVPGELRDVNTLERLRASFADALEMNVSIQAFDFQGLPEPDVIARNKLLRRQRHALTDLARLTDATSFRSLTEQAFRARVLGFLLPPGCRWMPAELVATGKAAAPGPCGQERPQKRSRHG
mmetsp:Transcript_80391/g.222384  ORF Transcript_80391/g.222384 Transcript_80391/m.222384 type:complete len:453 (-) Transcript_80391:9-1367(-)